MKPFLSRQLTEPRAHLSALRSHACHHLGCLGSPRRQDCLLFYFVLTPGRETNQTVPFFTPGAGKLAHEPNLTNDSSLGGRVYRDTATHIYLPAVCNCFGAAVVESNNHNRDHRAQNVYCLSLYRKSLPPQCIGKVLSETWEEVVGFCRRVFKVNGVTRC